MYQLVAMFSKKLFCLVQVKFEWNSQVNTNVYLSKENIFMVPYFLAQVIQIMIHTEGIYLRYQRYK